MCISKLNYKQTAMEEISVVKKLLRWAIISIIVNSMSVIIFIGGYSAIVVLYSVSASSPITDGEPFSIIAAGYETFSVVITVVCSTLSLLGSCFAVAPLKKKRIAGFVLSLVSIWILSMHFVINVFVLMLTFTHIDGNVYLAINGSVLVPIVVSQLIMLIYNSIFVCVVGCSLRKEK